MLPDFLLSIRRGGRASLGIGLLAVVLGCERHQQADGDPAPTATNTLTLEFQHNAPGDTLPLRLNTPYQTAAGQTYRLDKFVYYVSNIKLRRADGTAWAEPHSYHLLRVAGIPADNPTVAVAAVPVGAYTAIEFSIGVDSAANHHGDQQGALSPNEGMIWNWNTGYRFWVLEGDFLPAGDTARTILHHIGADRLYRTVRLPFPTAPTVTTTTAPTAHVYVDVTRFFTSVNLADPQQRNSMTTTDATLLPRLADNVTTMFRVAHVHSD
ncbi:MAG: hypothetical protein H7330_16615 [Hymenobacteraceae bacterium]|nr:hypothetical protein [Hymenobacteraceae bacterium]